MSTGMNLKNLFQNEYSFEEKINENFFKVESFSTLSIKSKISSSRSDNVENERLYLIEENNDEVFKTKVNQVACYNANLGWFFYLPKEGNIAYLQNEERFIYFNGNEWVDFNAGNSTIQGEDGTSIDVSQFIKKASNLSDVLDREIARKNLDVYAKSDVYNKTESYSKDEIDQKLVDISTDGIDIDLSGYAKTNNNLSDLSNKATARKNLDVYSKSEVYAKTDLYNKTEIDNKIANIDVGDVDLSAYAKTNNNLSDLSNKETARTNLDVYAKSETFNKSKNLLDILDQDSACHNIGTLRDWEIRRVGDYKISAMKEDHDNWLLCDGKEVSRTEYAELFALIGTTCGAGNGTTTFNIPDFRNKTMWGADGNLNQTLTSGLPNISGSLEVRSHSVEANPGAIIATDGTFRKYIKNGSKTMSCIASGGTSSSTDTVNFLASRSNAIYGSSTIVQPPAVCVNVFICAK